MERALVPLLMVLLASGCAVKRTLTITSNPPGAEVRLDGRRIGTTPLEHRFDHYGVRRITLQHPECLTWEQVVRIDPPWWNRFPVDYLSEILFPFGWRDRRSVHALLAEGTDVLQIPDLKSVLERKGLLSNAGEDGPVDFPPPEIRPIPTDDSP